MLARVDGSSQLAAPTSSRGLVTLKNNGTVLDPRTLVHPQAIGPVTVQNSKEVTVGTKIINITVDNTEKVTGQLLGLEFVSETNRSRTIRCSCAVAACFVLLVAVGILIFILRVSLKEQIRRIELDLPFYAYLWDRVKSTSRAERYACGVIAVVLLVCLVAVLYFTLRPAAQDSTARPNKGPGWYVNRTEWLAELSVLEESDRMCQRAPLVVINHSLGAACYDFLACAAEMRYIQNYYIHDKKYVDGPYNFAVGTDGRVYEGRGWGHAAAHTLAYNKCALGIGYLGDYSPEGRRTEATSEQVSNMFNLLQRGVELGHLRADYVIVAHRDLRASDSPGENLLQVMRTWTQYDPKRYGKMTCDQILQLDTDRL